MYNMAPLCMCWVVLLFMNELTEKLADLWAFVNERLALKLLRVLYHGSVL